MRAISIAPIMVEKIAKKARSLSAGRRPGIKGSIRSYSYQLRDRAFIASSARANSDASAATGHPRSA